VATAACGLTSSAQEQPISGLAYGHQITSAGVFAFNLCPQKCKRQGSDSDRVPEWTPELVTSRKTKLI